MRAVPATVTVGAEPEEQEAAEHIDVFGEDPAGQPCAVLVVIPVGERLERPGTRSL